MSLTYFVQVLQVAEAVSLEQERNSMSTAGGLYIRIFCLLILFIISTIILCYLVGPRHTGTPCCSGL